MALRPISRIDDYDFPEHAWDVRGWTVRTEAGDSRIGKVADMLLDAGGTLRYLDVDLGLMKKHVLVPLDHAHADEDSETVWIERLSRQDLEDAPEYALDPESLDEAYERRLDSVYGGTKITRHRDLVAPQEDEDEEVELHRLDAVEDEYRVSGDDPRGWSVVTGDGRKVAKVASLLVDPGAMKARFLDVVVDEKELGLEPVDRHILLPSEHVRLDRRKKHVVVAGLLAGDLDGYPPYTGLPLKRRFTRRVNEYFERAGAARAGEIVAREERTSPGADWRDSSLRHFYRRPARPRDRATPED